MKRHKKHTKKSRKHGQKNRYTSKPGKVGVPLDRIPTLID